MFIISNALKSITRAKGRNILIGMIVFVIAASSCVALSIRNAAKEAEESGLDSVSITGTISVDREKLMSSVQSDNSSSENEQPDMDSMRELMSEYQDLSLKELLTYANSDYVKDFYYSSSMTLNATGDIEAYSTESSSDESSESGFGQMGGQGRMPGGMTMGDFSITGYSSENAMTNFVNGTSQITEGEMFDVESNSLTCLISSSLAAFNGLEVGDKITLSNPNAESETYTFTISGIYTDSTSSESNNMRFSTSQDPANSIIISYKAFSRITAKSESVATTETDDSGNEQSTALTGQLSSTFVFSSQDNYESFSSQLTEKGLSEYYTLNSSDISNYESSLVPLQNLSKFATTLLFIVLAVGAVILIVLNMFNIRERKYEVGVLTAIGIKKNKVAMQFVTELLCVTFFSIIVGAGMGAAISVPISNNLLASQIEQTESSAASQEQSFGRPGGGPQGSGGPQGGGMMNVFGSDNQSDVTYMDKLNASMDFNILGQLMGIGILLTCLSSLTAVVFILRYEPLKILANRA